MKPGRVAFLAVLGLDVAAASWIIVQVIDRSAWWAYHRPSSDGASLLWNMAACAALTVLGAVVDSWLPEELEH